MRADAAVSAAPDKNAAEQTVAGSRAVEGAREKIGVLVASTRRRGNCERLVQRAVLPALAAAGAKARLLRLTDYKLSPCLACERCHETGECVLSDGFDAFERDLEGLDALVVVAPIYFGGPSAQFKAVLDRCQAAWARRYVLGQNDALPYVDRTPLALVAVGGSEDEFGFDALAICVQSAMRMLNFELIATDARLGYVEQGGEEAALAHEEDARAFAGWFADELASGGVRDMLAEVAAARAWVPGA